VKLARPCRNRRRREQRRGRAWLRGLGAVSLCQILRVPFHMEEHLFTSLENACRREGVVPGHGLAMFMHPSLPRVFGRNGLPGRQARVQ